MVDRTAIIEQLLDAVDNIIEELENFNDDFATSNAIDLAEQLRDELNAMY